MLHIITVLICPEEEKVWFLGKRSCSMDCMWTGVYRAYPYSSKYPPRPSVPKSSRNTIWKTKKMKIEIYDAMLLMNRYFGK